LNQPRAKTDTPPLTRRLPEAWERFRDNPIRHLTALAIYTESAAMTALSQQGYPQLVMAFSGPLSLLARRPRRLTELADNLSMSKQLCLQSLRPIEAAGYIQRRPDPQDKRAKLLELSHKGNKLVNDALDELATVNSHFEGQLGKRRLAQLSADTAAVTTARQPAEFSENGQTFAPTMLSATLGALTRNIHRQLMEADIAAGHTRLQPSYGQVLVNIDLSGTPLGHIAQQNRVSTQAISRIARELEARGYVQRRAAQEDGRSTRLYFTSQGLQLIVDSVDAMTQLEDELKAVLGETRYQRWCGNIGELYHALSLDPGLLAPYSSGSAEAILAGDPGPKTEGTPDTAPLLRHLAGQLLAPGHSSEEVDALLMAAAQAPVLAGEDQAAIESKLGKRDTQSLNRLLATLRA